MTPEDTTPKPQAQPIPNAFPLPHPASVTMEQAQIKVEECALLMSTFYHQLKRDALPSELIEQLTLRYFKVLTGV